MRDRARGAFSMAQSKAAVFKKELKSLAASVCRKAIQQRTRNYNFLSRGSTILEQALVYPLLLGVVIGAVDISRIFQGYSVLDEGMRSALRCVSPANGACINAVPVSSNPFYDIYYNTTPTRYRVQQHKYLGEASWLTLPIQQVNRVQAAVVSTLNYQAEHYQYKYQLERFRPQGQVGFAVETQTFPYVTRDNVPFLSPRIQASANSSRLATATVRIGAPALTLRHVSAAHSRPGYRSIPSARINFTIPRSAVLTGAGTLEATEECFLAAGTGVDFTKKCQSNRHFSSTAGENHIRAALAQMNISQATSRSETDQYAFVLIDIRGNVSSSNGAQGKVNLRLSQPGGINRTLGGRIISGVGAMHFVPRGGPPALYDASVRDSYQQEVVNHQALLVKLGVEATLHFEIEADQASADLLEWRASEIAIYTPRFETRTESARCDKLISRAGFENDPSAHCPRSLHPAGMPRPASLVLASTPEQVLEENLCLAPQNLDANAELMARGIEEAQHYQRVAGPSAQACAYQPTTINCPENKGVTGLMLADFNVSKEVCASELAASVCPFPERTDFTKACWKIAAKDISPAQAIRWVQESCTQTQPLASSLPAAITQYQEILLQSEPVPGEHQRLYTSAIAPPEYKATHAELNCDAVAIAEQSIGNNPSELKPESLFLRTSSLGSTFQEQLFKDAQRNFIAPEKNINPAAFFKATENVNSVLLDQPPTDPHQVYWVESAGATNWQLIATRVSDSYNPEQCLTHPELCRRELVSIVNNQTTESGYSPQRAAAIGYQAIEAAMPALTRACTASSKSCANLVVEEQSDETGKIFVARGELRVPLILSPKPYTISRVSQARWERDLIDK